MYLHANAKLGLAGRLALVQAIEQPPARAQLLLAGSQPPVPPAVAVAGATQKAAAAAFCDIPFAIASVSAKRPAGPSLALA